MLDRRYEWAEGCDIQFRVIGLPGSQGSKTQMPNGAMVEGGSAAGRQKLKDWRLAVTAAAVEWRGDEQWILIDEPIRLRILFLFPRPKSHTKKRLGNPWHFSKPDQSKIIRSTEDAITGILWRDDALVASHRIDKKYCIPGQLPGAIIRIENLRRSSLS